MPAEESPRYVAKLGAQTLGPFTIEGLKELATHNAVTPETGIAPEGTESFKPIREWPFAATVFPPKPKPRTKLTLGELPERKSTDIDIPPVVTSPERLVPLFNCKDTNDPRFVAASVEAHKRAKTRGISLDEAFAEILRNRQQLLQAKPRRRTGLYVGAALGTLLIAGILYYGLFKKAHNGEIAPVFLKEDAIGNEVLAFNQLVRMAFENERFGALEKIATQALEEKARFGNGSWKIVQFHWAIIPPDLDSNTDWKRFDELTQKWEAKYPESITARVQRILFLTQYAWAAQGAKSAKVKPEASPLFESRLADAKIELVAAKGLAQKSPMLWEAGFTVALGQGWSKEDAVAWYYEGQASEPGFWDLENQLTCYLLPRWYGKEGEWEAFALYECNRKGSLGEEGYARTVAVMARYYDNIFRKSRVQWPLVKKGFDQLRARYSKSLYILNQYASLAVQAMDRPTAILLFDEINGRADPQVWPTIDKFEAARDWAFSPGKSWSGEWGSKDSP